MAKWELGRDENGTVTSNEVSTGLLPLTDEMWERITEGYMDGRPFNNCRLSLPKGNVATVDFYLNLDGDADEQKESLQEALDKVPGSWVLVTTDDDQAIDTRFFNVHFHLGEWTGSILHLTRRVRMVAKAVEKWKDKPAPDPYYRFR